MREFDELPLVRADLARFDARCMANNQSTAAVVHGFRDLYRHQTRSLIVDGSRNWLGVNGIGNHFGDFTLWIALAAVSRRALFVDWGRDLDDARRSGRRRYDLFEFFGGVGSEGTHGDGWDSLNATHARGDGGGSGGGGGHDGRFDWAWNDATRERLSWHTPLPTAHRWDKRVPCGEVHSLLLSLLLSDNASVRIDIPDGQGIALCPICQSPEIVPAFDLQVHTNTI